VTEATHQLLTPRGPRWPDAVQSVLLMRNRPTVMRRLQRKYGDVFAVRMPYGPHGSMVASAPSGSSTANPRSTPG
jgi:hypothetical protein